MAAMVASCTKRRFQCRRFGHGSGWIRSIRASECGGAHASSSAGIAREQPDIADVMGLDLCQDLRHAVDIRFAADEAGVGKGAGFRHQMLAAAESDFEPDRIDRRIEQPGEIRQGGTAMSSEAAATGVRSGPPGAAAVYGPCAGQRTSLAGEPHRRTMRRVPALADQRTHRSVWYSRYSSRVRGSIDEI